MYSFENALKSKCGFQGSSPYWDWRKGNSHILTLLLDNEYRTDASDVFGSPFFKDSDPESGLGGWGDLNQDIEVQDGGFSVNSSFRLSYPSPHPLRRNFTLQPYLNVGPPKAQFIQDPAVYANSSLTYSVIDSIINGYVGDFRGFQTAMEAFQGPVFLGHGMLGELSSSVCVRSHPYIQGVIWVATALAMLLRVVSMVLDLLRVVGRIFLPSSLFPHDFRTIVLAASWGEYSQTAFCSTLIIDKMIDKVWAEWQSKDEQNANAFYAGTVQALENATYFNEWPTGAPPLLQVCETIIDPTSDALRVKRHVTQ